MKFLKNLFSSVPSPFNQAQHDSATLKAMQGKMLKHQFFAGLLHHSHSPVFVDPHKGLVLQDSAQSFEQLASFAIQARVKGYRVIWVSPRQSISAIDAINDECEQVMDLRGFVPCALLDDRPFAAQTDSLFVGTLPHRVSSKSPVASALESLVRYLTHHHNMALGAGAAPASSHSQAYAQKGEPFFILQGFSSEELQGFWGSFADLLKSGAYAWVATVPQLSRVPSASSENTSFLESHARYRIGIAIGSAWIEDRLDETGAQSFDVGLWRNSSLHKPRGRSHFWPSSVFGPQATGPLCWVGCEPENVKPYLKRLLRQTRALDGIFEPNLAVEPYFVRDNQYSEWHYDIQGNRVMRPVLASTSELASESTVLDSPCWISRSMVELSELLFWVYELQCPALFKSPDAQNLRSKVQALFHDQANSLYKNSKAVSFNAVALLFSNVLQQCALLNGSVQAPRFEDLPALLRTVIWLQAYRLALPADTPWQVLGVAFTEPLDVLAPLTPAAYRCLSYLIRASRKATVCYFLTIEPEQYAKVLSAFGQGQTSLQNTQSWMSILQLHFETLFQLDELEPTT